MKSSAVNEWLEADGLGGFASGTATGKRTRREHALLLAAKTPPTERFALVNGFEARITTAAGCFLISSERYDGNTCTEGHRFIESFAIAPWPHWRFTLPDGTEFEQAVFVVKGAPLSVLSWRLLSPPDMAVLEVRPFMSGRGRNALHRENTKFNFRPTEDDGVLTWHPYPDVPYVRMWMNGNYRHEPDWYRNFRYEGDRRRGLDYVEDLASPGVFRWDLAKGEAIWMMLAGGVPASYAYPIRPLENHLETLRVLEEYRRSRIFHRCS